MRFAARKLLPPIPNKNNYIPNETNNEKIIADLFKHVKKLSISSDSDSQESDLEDVFGCNSFLKPRPGKKRKFYTKYEADKKTVEQFTEDFKKAMNRTRTELKINHPLTLETDEDIERAINSSNYIFIKHQEPIKKDDVINIKDKEFRPGSSESRISEIWQLLLAYSKPTFKVTPPGYDAFRQGEKHWLERPELPWSTLNESIVKCERWLLNEDK